MDISRTPVRRVSVSLPWLFSTSIPVALFLLFAAVHLSNWRQTGHLTGALLVAQELVFVVLFVLRRSPVVSSRQPWHWIVAMGGSFTGLLLRPSAPASRLVEDVALLLQVAGACASIVCLISLGRSFGIVPANRGARMGGPYRLVRHPIYTSYLISWAGYVVASPTMRNAIVLAVSLFFQLQRIAGEERVLSRDDAYRSYAKRVTYRLIPRIY